MSVGGNQRGDVLSLRFGSGLALILSACAQSGDSPAQQLQKGPRSGNPPHITSQPPTLAHIGVAFTYDVAATDPDAGDALTFTLPKKPAGAAIDSSSGLIQWTPTPGQLGSN